jgi:hypothetical protein
MQYSAAGDRLFDVFMNGTQVLTNFDIVASSGAEGAAVIEQFTVPVDNSGALVVGFTNVLNGACVNGIEIDQMAPLTVAASPANGGSVSGGGIYIPNSSQTISVTANVGFSFSQWQDGNTQNPRTVTVPAGGTNCTAIFTQSQGSLFFAVNAGGPAEGTFAADADYSGGTGNPSVTTATIEVAAVRNPAPQAVYQSERYGSFSYTFTNLIPGNSYFLRLHFAEVFSQYFGVGDRLFNVSINGTQVLTNFDIYATAGAGNTPVIAAYTVQPGSSGQIGIGFTNVLNGAKVSGIELYNMSGNAPSLTMPIFTNGGFHTTLNGMASSNYVVYVSTNLINWQQLGGTVTAQSCGTTNIIDNTGVLRARFYRAVRP